MVGFSEQKGRAHRFTFNQPTSGLSEPLLPAGWARRVVWTTTVLPDSLEFLWPSLLNNSPGSSTGQVVIAISVTKNSAVAITGKWADVVLGRSSILFLSAKGVRTTETTCMRPTSCATGRRVRSQPGPLVVGVATPRRPCQPTSEGLPGLKTQSLACWVAALPDLPSEAQSVVPSGSPLEVNWATHLIQTRPGNCLNPFLRE